MLPPRPSAMPCGQRRRRERDHLEPERLDRASCDRQALDDRGEDARREARNQPVADLVRHEAPCGVGRHLRRVGLGDADRDEEQRDADAVVEAALDVQPLTDAGGKTRVGDDRLPQRGVRAREDHRQHQRLGCLEARQHGDAHQGARENREWKPDPEQAQRHGVFDLQRPQRDPGGVGEQHKGQRGLRQDLERLAADVEVDQPEHRAGDQPRRGEEDRRRYERSLEPAGRGCEREDEERDRGESPGLHCRPTLSEAARGACTGAPYAWRW